jgi:hypothetical protein
VPQLPIPAEHLAELLSRPLAPRPGGWQLTVTHLHVVEEHKALRVVMAVTCRPDAASSAQQWRVAVPVGEEDLDSSVLPQTLVTILRANLEEWWDTKSSDPQTGSWAIRTDDPDVQ